MRNAVRRIKRSLRGCKFGLSLRLCLFEEEYSLDLFGYLIALPFMDRFLREPKNIMESWGIYAHERSVVLCWADHTKFIYLPWAWEHVSHEVRRPDGSWVPYVAEYEKDKEPDGKEVLSFPYTYVLKNGEKQEATAEVYVGRRTWVWRWFQWLGWPRMVCQSIDVRFDREIGERSGSWKGGCIGTGYEMRPNETAEQTLRRMELERVFD